MPVRPAGIGRPKADADFEAEVYSLEIPLRPCYVRTGRMARRVVFPTPEVRIVSDPMLRLGACPLAEVDGGFGRSFLPGPG